VALSGLPPHFGKTHYFLFSSGCQSLFNHASLSFGQSLSRVDAHLVCVLLPAAVCGAIVWVSMWYLSLLLQPHLVTERTTRCLRPTLTSAELGTCRPAVRVSGLLDLPARALHLVVSFLGTLDRAAACLTCRALRDAAKDGHQHVTFELTGWYIAKARASPHVLRSLHTFQSLLDRLDEEHQRDGSRPGKHQ
jgi:hypothetical protein